MYAGGRPLQLLLQQYTNIPLVRTRTSTHKYAIAHCPIDLQQAHSLFSSQHCSRQFSNPRSASFDMDKGKQSSPRVDNNQALELIPLPHPKRGTGPYLRWTRQVDVKKKWHETQVIPLILNFDSRITQWPLSVQTRKEVNELVLSWRIDPLLLPVSFASNENHVSKEFAVCVWIYQHAGRWKFICIQRRCHWTWKSG